MGTKNKPGNYDCYANAHPDEPMFILLGRDSMAPALVEMWAEMRVRLGEEPAKVAEAMKCAEDMRLYLHSLGKAPIEIYREAASGSEQPQENK